MSKNDNRDAAAAALTLTILMYPELDPKVDDENFKKNLKYFNKILREHRKKKKITKDVTNDKISII